jgi:hypothetical protein
MLREFVSVTVVLCLFATSAAAQQVARAYAGALAGVSTLSADARSEVTPNGADASLYVPENGAALNLVVGVHIHDYVTFQANYVWNVNDVVLTSIRAVGSSFYEQPRTSAQHAVVGDLLLYFRNLRSVLRPYLSVGGGIVRVETMADGESRARNAVLPVANSQATRALLRVAVGIDVAVGGGWSARYTFSESLSGNPFSAQLSPAGQRNLANFQNLAGIVRAF